MSRKRDNADERRAQADRVLRRAERQKAARNGRSDARRTVKSVKKR